MPSRNSRLLQPALTAWTERRRGSKATAVPLRHLEEDELVALALVSDEEEHEAGALDADEEALRTAGTVPRGPASASSLSEPFSLREAPPSQRHPG